MDHFSVFSCLILLIFGTTTKILVASPPFETESSIKGHPGNWTLKDGKFKKNFTTIIKLCSFLPEEESLEYLNVCTASNPGDGTVRKERDVVVPTSTSSMLDNDHPPNNGRVNLFINTENLILRENQGQGHQGLALLRRVRIARDVTAHGHPPFLKSLGLAIKGNNLCAGQCILQKLGMLDSQLEPVKDVIVLRMVQVLNFSENDTTGNIKVAEGLVENCIAQWRKLTEKAHDNSSHVKCQAAVKLGTCLFRESFKTCRAMFIATHEKKGSINTTNKPTDEQ